MKFYPAIDLKEGQCVRLVRGEMDTATVFNPHPERQALAFEAAGCSWLHVVDLDGAFAGKPINTASVTAIREATGLKIQLGGGIRDITKVGHWLEAGLDRVILGTAAVQSPEFVREACRTFPGRVAVGIDARDGWVAVDGWADTTAVSALEIARRFEADDVAAIIYTDINRDGAMAGPNLSATVALAREVSIPVIVSGGVSSMNDLTAIKTEGGDVLDGVICGRALYEGTVDATAAVALLEDPVPSESAEEIQ